METSKFTRPDIINLALIFILGAAMTVHVIKSQGNHTLIATEEADHVTRLSTELKAIKAEIQELKAKNVTEAK